MRSLSCLPFAVAALGAVAISAASPVDAGTAHAAPAAAQAAPSRPAFTAEDRAAAGIPGFRDVRFYADDVDAFRSALPQAKGPWLAFSAGGSDGAFGAGLMVGLGKANRRPDFAMVTGASTGALTATYTFVGRAYDKALEEGYTQLTAADVFEIGATPESLVDAWPLKRMVEKKVTLELVAAVAREHAAGRRLFVTTTDMDAGRSVVWNMGAIAARGTPDAVDLFRKVLLASSSIPGLFQPVYFASRATDGRKVVEMHADGSIASPFYVMPPSAVAGRTNLQSQIPDLYVVVNGKLKPGFAQQEPGAMAALGRSFSLALAAGERSQIQALPTLARRDGTTVNVAAIDPAFDRTEKGAFDPDYMGALFRLGEQAAAKGYAFADAAQDTALGRHIERASGD